MECLVNYDYLKSILKYEASTGNFIRIKTVSGKAKEGMIAGYIKENEKTGKKYRQIRVSRIKVFAHRLAWFYVHKVWPEGQIDHIDGDGLNNRLDNLRVVSNRENAKNRKLSSRNTSGRMGVYWSKKDRVWYSQIVVNGKVKSLGGFHDFYAACDARANAEKLYEFHTNHGARRV